MHHPSGRGRHETCTSPAAPRRTFPAARRRRRSVIAGFCAVAALAVAGVVAAVPAAAGTPPAVTALSRHQGPYWGATRVTVRGSGFTDATAVLFGRRAAYALQVVSSTKIVVLDPDHSYGTVDVRVVTPDGKSATSSADTFTFTHPTMDTPIMGGLTARQEQQISAQVRAAHHNVRTAQAARRWTAAMGSTAAARARSWLGLPYSWAGGAGSGPTYGVCAHNGGDMDCHVVGFDCSGLALNAWAPYERLDHYAATQHRQAGRFHPRVGELVPGDLVFFSGYVPDGIGHVAVYTGHGMVVQAAQSGTLVMRSQLVDVIAEAGHYRGATRPMSTGQQGAGPVVSSVTAQLSLTGGRLVITGRRLGAATAVSVGRTRIYSFVRRTDTRLVVTAPAHAAGPVSVGVSNAWGTVTRTLTYVAPPEIASLSPATGPAAGGTRVTVSGTSFSSVRRVTMGGAEVPFRVVADDQLTFTTPAHSAGSVAVVLHSPFGRSTPEPYAFVGPTASGTPTSTAPAPDSSAATSPAASTGAGGAGAAVVPSRTTRATGTVRGRWTVRALRPGGRRGSRYFDDRIGERWFLVGRR